MIKKILRGILILALLLSPAFSFAEIGSVSTSSVTNLTDSGATLRGSVSSTDGTAYAYFRYSKVDVPPIFCNDVFGSNMVAVTADTPNASGQVSGGSFSATLDDLEWDTLYSYCAVVSNSAYSPNSTTPPTDIKYGQVVTFRTPPCENCPHTTIVTNPASVTGKTTATIKGYYNSIKPVVTYFEYRKKTTGTTIPSWITTTQVSHNAYTYNNIQFGLTGLTQNTTYEFRAVARTSSPDEVFYGVILTFKTYKDNSLTIPGADPATGDPGNDGGYSGNCPTGYTGAQPDCNPIQDSGGGPILDDDGGGGATDPGGDNGGGSGGNNYCPSGSTGVYPDCNPGTDGGGSGGGGNLSCPVGYVGTYPNCSLDLNGTLTCPSGYTGTYPNCVPNTGNYDGGNFNLKCPAGFTGAYPNCSLNVGGLGNCPSGYTGTYPNCSLNTDWNLNFFDWDLDNDGIFNNNDWDLDGDGILNIFDGDIDGDGMPNQFDFDNDMDGIFDYFDFTPNGVGTLSDFDGDGIPNIIDSTPLGGTGNPGNDTVFNGPNSNIFNGIPGTGTWISTDNNGGIWTGINPNQPDGTYSGTLNGPNGSGTWTGVWVDGFGIGTWIDNNGSLSGGVYNGPWIGSFGNGGNGIGIDSGTWSNQGDSGNWVGTFNNGLAIGNWVGGDGTFNPTDGDWSQINGTGITTLNGFTGSGTWTSGPDGTSGTWIGFNPNQPDGPVSGTWSGPNGTGTFTGTCFGGLCTGTWSGGNGTGFGNTSGIWVGGNGDSTDAFVGTWEGGNGPATPPNNWPGSQTNITLNGFTGTGLWASGPDGTSGTWSGFNPNQPNGPVSGTWSGPNGSGTFTGYCINGFCNGTWEGGNGPANSTGTWTGSNGKGNTNMEGITGNGVWSTKNGKDGTWIGTGMGDNLGILGIGSKAKPLSDAIVRYHEGVETVFIRQIVKNPEFAKRYGYVEGDNILLFSYNLAHYFGINFGYVDKNTGKEIRVIPPDVAAYQFWQNGDTLLIYEFFMDRIVNIRSLTTKLKDKDTYEYYFTKKIK